jgi:hypothetical protein
LPSETHRRKGGFFLGQMPQSPDSSAGSVYEFVDESVVPGATYWYWLEDVDVHGVATRHGPVSATVESDERARIYVLLVIKQAS